MIRPYGSLYLVRLLEAPDSTDTGIFLPETAREPIFDALVLAAGPGHWLPNGERAPLQARVGDRVVFQRPDFVPLEPGGDTGFVADSRLVALIPGPEHTEVRPAGDWVFLVPERSGRLAASEGGVLVAHYSLAGQDATALRRGDELHAEFVALEKTEAWRDAPTEFDRHKICHDYLEALSPWELEALGEAIERRGAASKWKAYVPLCKPPEVKAGTLHSWGPGRLLPSGKRGLGVAALQPGVDLGILVNEPRVHLDRQYRGVNLSDGQRNLLAVPAGSIAAVEVAA